MRTTSLFRTAMLLLLTAVVALPFRVHADRTVNQLQFGKQVIEVAADETITFYDMKGHQGISSSTSNNSQSLTVFKPAAGTVIQLTFTSFDIRNDGTTWPAHAIVYSGDPDADNTFSYATSTSGVNQSSTLPSGAKQLEKLDGTYTNKTYVSDDPTGIISVGYLYYYATQCDGWVATVKCMTVEDMEVTGASSSYDNVLATVTETEGVPFAAFNITANGIGNPDGLTAVSFTTPVNEGAIDATALRLYAGTEANYKAGTAIDGAVTEDGGVYTFTLTTPRLLSDGNNAFTLAGGFLGTAEPGKKASVNITQVATTGLPGGVAPFTAGTPVEVAKPAIALISTTPQVITVGDIPYNFYDDGGKDANITKDFEGYITFVPATEGYAIKIDFTSLDLFNTSSVGKNDVFKFYNGREVNESNLIATLLDEAELVKSTASDGSMTVYLKSTAGYPKAGWEALVSQFLPGDMTFTALTGETASSATVSCDDTDAQMIVFDVQTDNQVNPLSVTDVKLATTSANAISKARVYYLGKKNVYSTTNVFGETDAAATMTVSGTQELVEGHNYFAVVIDLNGTAAKDDNIDLSLTGVTVAAIEQAPATAITATRTVLNLCRATEGSHSHNISGEWIFKNTEGNSGKYEGSTNDYIVTFNTSVPNSKVEIDFSAFDVYYASSSYGTKAVFEIYSGGEVNSANLLWSLTDNAQSTTGPGRAIRSTAADGSMTIRFNPKTTSFYYLGTGWTASVRPFVNHDMTIESVTVNQTSSDVLAPGAVDAQLIDAIVVTEGTLTTKVIKNIALDLKNSQAALDKVSVYYNNVNNIGTAVLFGAVEAPETTAVNVAGQAELSEPNNYFWVTVDIKADAAAEAVIDAKLVSMTDAADVVTPIENGDPAGERVVKYIYLLTAGPDVITVTNPLMFYDDGGAEGKVSKGFAGIVTFLPGAENSAVELNTQGTFTIGSGNMYVYNGREVNDDNLLAKFSTTTGPANLISKAADGSLTVYYKGNTTASTLDGWAIAVTLHEKTPFVIDAVEAIPESGNLNRNMTDALMQKVKVTVSGDKDPITINKVKFTTTGTTDVADIDAAHLHYTAHSVSFGMGNEIAAVDNVTSGENVITLVTPVEISDNGDYYFWLTYDVAAEATTGNTLAATVTGISQGETEIVATATAAEREVVAGLKGTYTIGASAEADYPTFAAATAALANGIEGAVRFEVEDGTYAENVWFSNVNGTSATNTLTFVSKSGNRDNVKVTGSGTSEYMPGSSAYKKGVVFIENTPYVTLEKMSFIPARESEYNYVVQIYDRCRHFTLRDCYVKATPVTSATSGIYLVKTSAKNEDNCNNDYGTFVDNLLEGGYMGFALGGANYVALTREKGLVVRNNTVNEGYKGIYVYDEDDMLIENNTIYQSMIARTGYWGLDLSRVRGNTVVRNNKVTSATTYYSGGIELRGESYGTAEQPILVYNNVVNITKSPSNSTAGIQIDGDQKHITLSNNTVRIAGSGGYCYYTANRTPRNYQGIILQNNLFQNLSSSPVMFIHSNFSGMAHFTGNAFYGATILDGTDIDAFNGLEGNSGNIVEQADFLGENDLHLKSAGNLVAGTPIDYITEDADGKERAATPTIGAYEYEAIVVVAPEMEEGYPVIGTIGETSVVVKTKWNVSGKIYAAVEEVTTGTPAPARVRSLIPRRAMSTDDLVENGTQFDYTAGDEASATIDGLQPGTQYKAYLMLESALDGSMSDVVETDAFTTERHIDELVLDLSPVFDIIEAGESSTLEATSITGGDQPYTYEWRDQMNNVVSTSATATVTPDYTYGYRLTVTSADGQTATAKTAVYVEGEAVAASFEDNAITDGDYFNGDNDDDVFYSGSYAFHVSNMGAWWYGYAISKDASNAFSNYNDQYRSASGGGNNSSSQFCVAYPEGTIIEVTNNLEGEQLQGMYINNTAYAYSSMSNGDSFAKKFGQGDWFKLTVIGTHDDESTSSVEYYLADFRSENEADHFILNEWQWVDLSPLGAVTSISLRFSSTDNGDWGMNTPAYVAIDDFNSPNPDTPTGVTNVKNAKTVEKVTYVNLAGVESNRPFDGVNIVVTRYNDGTTSTVKIMK